MVPRIDVEAAAVQQSLADDGVVTFIGFQGHVEGCVSHQDQSDRGASKDDSVEETATNMVAVRRLVGCLIHRQHYS